MSVENIIKKIHSDNELRIANILEDTKRQIESIEEKSKRELADLESQYKNQTDAAVSKLQLVISSKAKQTGQLLVQQAKRDAVNSVKDLFRERILTLPAKEYQDYFKKRCEVVLKDISLNDINTIKAPKTREEETKMVLSELGYSGQVEYTNIGSGFILITADADLVISFESWLHDNVIAIEAIIAQHLFS